MQNLNFIQQTTICILPLLLAITVHEATHGIVAFLLGDRTAYEQGRVSLDPFKHLDLFGTVIFPVLCLLSKTGFIFGWAKPVPIDFRALKKNPRDEIFVSLAGPAANFLMAFLWGGILKLLLLYPALDLSFNHFFSLMCETGVLINLGLGFFNLLPFPTFDGGIILKIWLSKKQYSNLYFFFQRYGIWIILLLIVTGALTLVLLPLLRMGIIFIDWFYGL